MCGICGFIEGNQAKSTEAEGAFSREQILERMMTALIHRGPDQGKSRISGKAAFGFRRLSIIDLEGSKIGRAHV